jgi:hypothetical protein
MFKVATFLATASVIALATAASAADAPRPMFARGISKFHANYHNPAESLTTWQYSFTYQGKTYKPYMVGTDPTKGAVSTTTPTYLIPIEMIYGSVKESPSKKVSNGLTVTENTAASPIFSSDIDFQSGGTDLGSTQYIDAFQRGNLGGIGGAAAGYHSLLGAPTIEKTVKLKVPAGDGGTGTYFGVQVVTADINWFDGQIQTLIKKFNVPGTALPIFLTTQTYLTSGGCCIGGYHDFNGTNTYAMFTYIQKSGVFSQDVSALSHEIGEWEDDPYVNNSGCGGLLEVGDPLEGGKNYGGYDYTDSKTNFTYTLQDLVYLPYFGAPTSVDVGPGLFTFQGQKLTVCQNGQ